MLCWRKPTPVLLLHPLPCSLNATRPQGSGGLALHAGGLVLILNGMFGGESRPGGAPAAPSASKPLLRMWPRLQGWCFKSPHTTLSDCVHV